MAGIRITIYRTILLDRKNTLNLQVLTLKEQLSDAEKEIRRLSERSDGVSSNSPTSSLSNAVDVDPPFFGEFGVVDGLDNVFYIPENNYVSGMEWGYLYDM